jgi:phospholipid/cholesterol/gamma-HCH transport system substrate-binding protein
MSGWVPSISQAYRDYTLHINLETIPFQPTGYGPADTPEYGADYGPTCATLPSPPYSQQDPAPQPDFFAQQESDDGIAGSHGKYRPAPGFGLAAQPVQPAATSGWAGTAAEQRVVNALAAPVLDVPAREVPDVTTLLLGPIARGNEVSVR